MSLDIQALIKAIDSARERLDELDREVCEKTIWSSPAGKKRLAKRLVAMLPPHKTYVEPFAGSAAVLFEKQPAEVEAINDADQEIVQAYRAIQRLTKEKIARLGRMNWVGDHERFKKIYNSKPNGDLAKLHRFLYVTHFSYGRMRSRGFSPSTQGVPARTVGRLEKFAPRLKKVKIHGGDYERVVKQYDSPNTLFYLDPPYAGYDASVGENKFDEERFFNVLKSIKGKFLLTYGIRGKLPQLLKNSRFHVKRIRTERYIRAVRGNTGPTLLTQLVVTNYQPSEKPSASENVEGKTNTAEKVEKQQPFGTFGGSSRYAKRLLPLIPEHKTYVEPFAGAAALLYAKEPSEREILGDVDSDIVFMHRFIKSMSEAKLERLRKLNWTCTEASWKRVLKLQPKDEYERFYKLAFIRIKGFNAQPNAKTVAGSSYGSTTNPEKFLKASERLKNVSILSQDYKKTIKQFDGPDTFFFIDPPYPGEWFDKNAVIDLDEFIDVLGGIKGKFIAVLNNNAQNRSAFKKVGRVFRIKVREASGHGGFKAESRLFCTNCNVAKSEETEEIVGEEWSVTDKAVWGRQYINDLPDSAFLYIESGGKKDEEGKTVPRDFRHFPVRDEDGNLDLAHLRNAIARIPQSKIPGMTQVRLSALQEQARKLLVEAKESVERSDTTKREFVKEVPIIKNLNPGDERYVLGIVLEPETVDSQGDIYSAAEIRQAAHKFMEDFGGLGIQHRFRANDQVKILETYLAPTDMTIGNAKVRKGTWLLAVRILSDELWQQVKDGNFTGFSIGGSARKLPENNPRNSEAA